MEKGKVLEGVVTSQRCDKTITVLVKMKFSHQLYKRPLIKKKKFQVHDVNNEAKAGNRVKIIECRPISKDKHFKLLEILNPVRDRLPEAATSIDDGGISVRTK